MNREVLFYTMQLFTYGLIMFKPECPVIHFFIVKLHLFITSTKADICKKTYTDLQHPNKLSTLLPPFPKRHLIFEVLLLF